MNFGDKLKLLTIPSKKFVTLPFSGLFFSNMFLLIPKLSSVIFISKSFRYFTWLRSQSKNLETICIQLKIHHQNISKKFTIIQFHNILVKTNIFVKIKDKTMISLSN